jgi:hypothetical protein
MQITLLSFLFKKFTIIKKGINIKDTLKQDALRSVNSLGLYNYAHYPELSGKVEYERERLNNTVLKCGRPYK